jgi:hypothetical protein
MNSSTTPGMSLHVVNNSAWHRAKPWLLSLVCIALMGLLLPSLAHATGTGGSDAAQARINAVANSWQSIVQGVGVAVLVVAWSYIGYQIAFAGKTMKDMFATMLGSSIAGLAPVLVAWLFT